MASGTFLGVRHPAVNKPVSPYPLRAYVLLGRETQHEVNMELKVMRKRKKGSGEMECWTLGEMGDF